MDKNDLVNRGHTLLFDSKKCDLPRILWSYNSSTHSLCGSIFTFYVLNLTNISLTLSMILLAKLVRIVEQY
jgi:hypothetical protein